MRRFLVVLATLVALVAALLPQPVRAGGNDTLQNVAAGIQIFSFIRDLTQSNKPAATAVQPIAITANRMTIDPLCQRRVVIDESQMTIGGTRGGRAREIIASKLQALVSKSGKCAIAIGGRDFQFMAQTMDQIHESGYYSEASRAQVKKGGWLAPTDIMKMSGTVDVNYDDKNINLNVSRQSVNIAKRKATVIVHLTVSPVGLGQGLYGQIVEADAQLEGTIDFRASGYGSNVGSGNYSANSYGAEDELVYQSLLMAMSSLVSQLDLPKLQEAAMPTTAKPALAIKTVTGTVTLVFQGRIPCVIDIPAGKSLRCVVDVLTGKCLLKDSNSKIIFVRDGQKLGEFRVKAIQGQTVILQLLSGSEPVDGDGFALPSN